MWKITFGIFVKSLRFETPWVRKNNFFESVCLSSVDTITLDRIIGLNWNSANRLRAEKDRTSSLASHYWPMVLVLFIKNIFVRIKKSIFPTKYTGYGINVQKQNSLFQRYLQISWWFFVYWWKILLKIKTFGFQKNCTIRKKVLET